MCSILENLVIGIISGAISSYLVSLHLNRIEKKRKAEQDFKDDMQTYHRWILRVRNELEIAQRIGDSSSLLRAIEEEPVLKSFENLSEQSIEVKRVTDHFIRALADQNGSQVCADNKFKRDMGMLYKYSVDALMYTSNQATESNCIFKRIVDCIKKCIKR